MEHAAQFFLNLNKIYNNNSNSNSNNTNNNTNSNFNYNSDSTFTDVTLHCLADGSTFSCHRIILASSSDYFDHAFRWSRSDVVDIHSGITSHTMETILRYIYSDRLSLTCENVTEILVAASFLGIQHLVDACVGFVQENLDEESYL